MNASLRFAATIVLGSTLASSAWAASSADATATASDEAPSPPPASAAVSTAGDQNFGVRLAGDQPAATAAASGQNSCGCDACSPLTCSCDPIWTVSAGALILHRDRPTAGTTVGTNPFDGTAFSRGSDFNFNWEAGPDLTIERRFTDIDSLDARFFNNYETATTGFVTPGGFIGAGFTGPGGTAFFGRDFTKLTNLELNWRRQTWDHLALLAGFREIQLKDEAIYQINSTVATGSYAYRNYLYGGQLGADWSLTNRSTALQFDVVGKAGVYANSDNGGITEFSGSTPIGSFLGQGNTTSFVGELDLMASYALTDHVSIHGGYQFFWLTDLALAADAASRSLLNPSLLRTVDDSGNLFYQGASVGLDVVW